MSEENTPIEGIEPASAAAPATTTTAAEPPGVAPAAAVSLTISVDQLLGILAAALVIFGSFGAWFDAGIFAVSGIKGDGVITLILGILALPPIIVGRWRAGVFGIAVLALLVVIYDAGRVASISDEEDLFEIAVGWGLIAVGVGAVGLAAWALYGLVQSADKRPAIAAGAVALVALAVTITLAATGTFGEANEEVAERAPAEVEPEAEPVDTATSEAPASTSQAPSTVLKIGEQARLSGANDVEAVVTLERVVDPLAGGEFDAPTSGKRFVGVMLRITNTGDATYDDSPGNGAILTYGDDRQATSSIVSGGACSGGFASGVKISPGSRRKGCIVFEVPRANKIKAFQFTLDSGFAEESAEWRVRSADGSGKPLRRAASSEPAYVPPAEADAPSGGGTHACDQNISAGSGTTCAFANDVFRSYAAAVQSGGGSDQSLSAYSSAAGRSIDVYCSYAGGDVTCTGGDSALVTFPKWAADVY